MAFENKYGNPVYEKDLVPDEVLDKKNNIYDIIHHMNSPTVFKYIVILIATYFLFKHKSVSLAVILGLVIGVIVVYYLYVKSESTVSDRLQEHKLKVEHILPEPEKIKSNERLVDFLFSIQDMYQYNPQAYEEMMDNIEAFLTIYDTIMKGVRLYDYYYGVAVDKKENAVNALQSIIYKLPSSKALMNKHMRSHKRLETILTDIINEMYDKCKEYRIRYGTTIHNKVLLDNPKPYNNYEEGDNYQFY